MHKIKFIFINIKKLAFPFCICLFIFCLVAFSDNNLIAAKSGLQLWALFVVPSIFPFFIATELLSFTDITKWIGKLFSKIMNPIFNLPGEAAYALIMGIISGYPTGAKVVSNLKEKRICNDIECERLISFTNNAGPLFIVGTVGAGLFGNSKIGILLLVTHILACLTVGFLFRFWKSNYIKSKNSLKFYRYNQNRAYDLGEVLNASIMNSINTILMIGGYIVIFSIIISVCKNSNLLYVFSIFINPILAIFNVSLSYSNYIAIGLIELTNGLQNIVSIVTKFPNINIIIASFMIGFGGLSILSQVYTITSKAKISIKPYLIGKILQACFASFYTWLILLFI